MSFSPAEWSPTAIKRFIRAFPTSVGTALVETDQGTGYLKGLGNPEGPHALACELVGTSLAEWLGGTTLDYALIPVRAQDEIPLPKGGRVAPGKAFITKAEPEAITWGWNADVLTRVSNRAMFTKLVVLDTWMRNCDRYAPDGNRANVDNVLLIQESEPVKALNLIAMDFTHAFTCGDELTKRLSYVERVKDPKIYGLFPQFRQHLNRAETKLCAQKLSEFTSQIANQILSRIPSEWEVTNEVKSCWNHFLTERAHFLADNVESLLWPQLDLITERA